MYCVDCKIEYDEYPCPLCENSWRKPGMKINFDKRSEKEFKKKYEDVVVELLIPQKKNKNV